MLASCLLVLQCLLLNGILIMKLFESLYVIKFFIYVNCSV